MLYNIYGDSMIDKIKINEIISSIPNNVCVIAATKYIDESEMVKLYECGINNFGENRVDSFLRKYEILSHLDIKWHFIGHLQRNKAKEVINKINCLHSLDSLELAKIINKERKEVLDCFIEVKLTDSETKDGIKIDDLENFIIEAKKYPKINIIGLMCMTEPNMIDEEKCNVFLKANELAKKNNLKCLSMGMSDDYQLAIKAGSTHVRLGRILY